MNGLSTVERDSPEIYGNCSRRRSGGRRPLTWRSPPSSRERRVRHGSSRPRASQALLRSASVVPCSPVPETAAGRMRGRLFLRLGPGFVGELCGGMIQADWSVQLSGSQRRRLHICIFAHRRSKGERTTGPTKRCDQRRAVEETSVVVPGARPQRVWSKPPISNAWRPADQGRRRNPGAQPAEHHDRHLRPRAPLPGTHGG